MARILAPAAIATAAALLAAQPALAQEQAPDSYDLRVRVGAGVQTVPRFPGADKNELRLLPKVSIARGDRPFGIAAPDDGFGIGLVSGGGFSAGPVLNLTGSRTDKDVGVPLGKVPATIEVGGYAQYDLGKSLRLRGEVRKGLGGHGGIVSSLGADYVSRDGDRYTFTIGPRLLLSNSRYQRAYFGVTPEAALASGLPAYRPGGGIHAVALTSGGTLQLGNGPFGLFGFARFERLVGDAARSPIVRELGSRNQYSAGAGITYTFPINL